MISTFEAFSKDKMDVIYTTESMRTDWLQNIYEFQDELDKLYLGDFDFCPDWLFRY